MLEKVRSAIKTRLASLGATDVADLRETILVRQGLYCGRKFECDSFHVVWFVEENQVKFYSRDGRLLSSLTAEQCTEPLDTSSEVRRAA